MKYNSLIFFLLLTILSCKKKEPVNPSPIAVDDEYVMYDPDTEMFCNVLENDHYTGEAVIPDRGYIGIYCKYEVIDSKIYFIPDKNAYGNFETNYLLNDKNGSAEGKLKVKRGTHEQMITSSLIAQHTNISFNDPPFDQTFYLYAIDDDTSYFYKDIANRGYVRFVQKKEIEIQSPYLPSIDRHDENYYLFNKANYSITTDGIIHALDSNGNEVSLKLTSTFSETAKKPDMSGDLYVRGFTLAYNGKVYSFVMSFDLSQ